MKKVNLLLLSFIGFFIFLGIGVAVDCNVAGMHDWRGDKALLIALFSVPIGVLSILTMLYQIFKMKITPTSKFFGVVFFFIFLAVSIATSGIMSKQLCH